MSEIEKALEEWKAQVYGSGDVYPNNSESYKSDMILEVWTPRIKWFRPPMNRFFRWAYKIKKTSYTGVYPSGMK